MVMFESVRQVLAAGGVSARQARPGSPSWHHMLLFRIGESCVALHPSHLATEAFEICVSLSWGRRASVAWHVDCKHAHAMQCTDIIYTAC